MAAMEDVATIMVEIANRIGQLATNIVAERTARMGAEQHVQTLTAQSQTLSSNPTAQTQAQSTGLTVTKVCKLSASAKGAWNDWELVMWSYTRQLDGNADVRHDELSGVGS